MDDGPLLKRATELDRILVTQDEDLLREGTRLLKGRGDFSGIVYAHQLRVTIGQMVEDLELITKATSRTNGAEESNTCRSDEIWMPF